MPDLHGLQIKEAVAMSLPVVLITGALTGIGRATTLAFANEGARVVVSGRKGNIHQAVIMYVADFAPAHAVFSISKAVWLRRDSWLLLQGRIDFFFRSRNSH